MKKTSRSTKEQPYQTILKLFFKPLIKRLILKDDPQDLSPSPLSDGLATLMSVTDREIALFEATTSFNLPGAKLIRANKPERRGIEPKERRILKGFKFMARIDSRSSFVDLQYYRNRWDKAGDERVFRLTQAEWDAIKDRLIPLTKG